MPIQGLVRLRKHQFARQQAFGSVVAATRAYPFKGVPGVELTWTDLDIDTGSLDPTAAPYRGAPALSASLEAPALAYNDVPLLLSGFFGGAVEPTGAPAEDQTWVYEPASTTIDVIDPFTYEFGDDVLTDWYQLGDGILEGFDLAGPEGLGPITASQTWKFGSVASTGSTDSPVTGNVPTAGLSVDTNPTLVYLKDMGIYIADAVAELGNGQILDALHSFSLKFSGDIDEKRWGNGDQSFDVDAYARASRVIELECTFSKTSDTVGTTSESDAWMSDKAVDRYVQLAFESTEMAHDSTPYSWIITFPMRYYTRTEGEVGGNTAVVLTGRAWYDPTDLKGVFTSTVVNTLEVDDFGLAGS